VIQQFNYVRKAGLTPTDLGRVLKVNRSTCSMWLNGHKSPHHLHIDNVMRVLTAIERAVKSKHLPAALPREPALRQKHIDKIIRQHLS
jgi:hypothetical protein